MDKNNKLLDVEQITREICSHDGPQTTQKQFRAGIFHIHQKGGNTKRKTYSYEYSARVRNAVFESLRRNHSTGKIGAVLIEACGADDETIKALYKKNTSIEEAREVIEDACKKLL